jgi:hypothetical protein
VAHAFGKGRVVSGISARDVLSADGIAPDFEPGGGPPGGIDYIHRKDGEADIYFVCNRSDSWENISPTFRVAGKSPEIWLPDTGEMRHCPVSAEKDGRTTVPLQLEPWFYLCVFRSSTSARCQCDSKRQPDFCHRVSAHLTGVVEVHDQGGRISFLCRTGTHFFRDAKK